MDKPTRPPRDLTNAISTNVRELRKLNGLTQLELAQRVGLDPTALAKIETRKRNVSAEELWALAVALEVEVASLYHYPGAQEDRLLTMLVLAPERELDAQLKNLRHFVSGTGEGSLDAALRKIEDGVEEYRTTVPNPYERTASPDQVTGALADARRIAANHEYFSSQIEGALNSFEERTPQSRPQSKRAAQRNQAQRVNGRGSASS